MDTKEIVALTEKWLEQLKEVTVNYQKAIDDLAIVRKNYDIQTKKWYNTVLPRIVPIITIIVLLIAFWIILHVSGCPNPIDIRFQDLELTQHCR